MHDAKPETLAAALSKLCSIREGDIGVVEAAACGPAAIPALRNILFQREASGLSHIRRHSVEALSRLGAHDVLRDFLTTRQPISDLVEQAGEDAVIDEAARSLGALHDRRDLPLLTSLVQTRNLPGVMEALGHTGNAAAVPLLIRALADDVARPSAYGALIEVGTPAVAPLFAAALQPELIDGRETASSRILRRWAMRLIQILDDGNAALPPGFADLLADHDPCVAVRACSLCLARRSLLVTPAHLDCLFHALTDCDGSLAQEIEDVLVSAYRDHPHCVDALIAHVPPPALKDLLHPRNHTAQAAEHIKVRLGQLASAPGNLQFE